jgi:hypothetical protein
VTHAKESRVHRSIRISPGGDAAVQEIASRYGCDWSEAVRRMLRVAYPKMPDRWIEEF